MDKKTPLKLLRVIITVASSVGLMIFAGMLLMGKGTSPVFAQGTDGHADCLNCHSNPNMIGIFSNSETLQLYIEASLHYSSIHGERSLGCKACHVDQADYPHELSSQESCISCHQKILNGNDMPQDKPLVFEIPLESRRTLSLQLNQTCKRCHEMQDNEVVNSDHTRIMKDGNPNAPVCLDCHGFHDVAAVDGSRSIVPQICSKCHMAVYTTYASSVHGAALAENANPDVPICGDCHGTHVVKGPDQANFRVDSIATCGKCHGDQLLMSKYGISVEVFNTYLNDFHGRVVDYSRRSGSLKVDQATCYDCHGVHNIMAPENETSAVYAVNLQRTCQQCHPDANITFPQAWLSHRAPDWNNTPVLFLVTQFYKFFIPIAICGNVIYISLDARRRIAARLKANRK